MSRRLIPILSINILVISVLACNLPGLATATATEPVSPSLEAPATSSPAEAAGACDNPLYPVIAGTTWSYSTTSTVLGDFTRSILAVDADGFTDQDVYSGDITRKGEWKCDQGTLIALQPDGAASAVVEANNITAEFHTTEMSGVTLPAAPTARRSPRC